MAGYGNSTLWYRVPGNVSGIILGLLIITSQRLLVQSLLIQESSSVLESPSVRGSPSLTGSPSILEDVICKRAELDSAMKDQCLLGYAWLCNGLQLSEVPLHFPVDNRSNPLCQLDLGNNQIWKIRNNTFANVSLVRWLNLQHNKIEYIDSDSFIGLPNLHTLELQYNRLSWPHHTSMQPGLFRHLHALQVLNIKVNNFTSFKGLDTELAVLSNLTQLMIDGCPACSLGPGFRKLKSLDVLDFAGHKHVYNGTSSCQMPRVTKHMFTNITQIRILNLFLCNITYIEPGAFSGLKRLYSLDIAYNSKLQFEGMKNATKGLCKAPLVKLNVNKIHDIYGRSTMLMAHHVGNFHCLHNLITVNMDLNRIEMVDENLFDKLPSSLEKVYLSGNRLTYGPYINRFCNISNIRELSVSRQNIYNDPFYHQHYHTHSVKKREISSSTSLTRHVLPPINMRLPKNLTKLEARQSLLYFGIGQFDISGPVKMTHLDVSFNLICPWTGPVSGLEHLEHLEMSVNYCQNVSVDFFKGFPSLKYLDISSNLLGYMIREDNKYYGKIFTKLKNLEVLNLSSNKLKTLPKDMFNNLNKLSVVNVSDNYLYKWNSTLSPCLETLDLSKNAFTDLSESLRDTLDVITNTRPVQCTNSANVTVVLSRNPVGCTCKSINFWKWGFDTNVELVFSSSDVCTTEDGHRHILHGRDSFHKFYINLNKTCPKRANVTLLVVGVSVASCFVGLVVATVVYRYRWKLRYIYHVKYRKRKRHSHGMYQRLSSSDAFCAYASDLDRFMYYTVVPQLEGEYNLKLWVFDRDCGLGTIAENIADAITSSRKTILFMSNEFLKDKWCDYGMNFADIEGIESSRKLIIIVLYDDIPVENMSNEIIRFLRRYDSIHWPPDSQDQTAFWAQLADIVTSD